MVHGSVKQLYVNYCKNLDTKDNFLVLDNEPSHSKILRFTFKSIPQYRETPSIDFNITVFYCFLAWRYGDQGRVYKPPNKTESSINF